MIAQFVQHDICHLNAGPPSSEMGTWHMDNGDITVVHSVCVYNDSNVHSVYAYNGSNVHSIYIVSIMTAMFTLCMYL